LDFFGFLALEAFPGGRGLLQEGGRMEMLVLSGRGRHWLSRDIVGEPRQRSANAPRGAAGAIPYNLPKKSEFYGRPTLAIYVIFSVGVGIPRKNKHILGP